MTERVYVHVGPHKTGTTYLQSLLTANNRVLADQGVLFPRQTWRVQSWAVRDVLRRGSMPTTGRDVTGEWDKLLTELAEWGGPSAVISHELFSSASGADVGRVCRPLQPYDVHLVVAARDLSRVAPAMWQTGLRSRQHYTWEEYAAGLRQPDQASGDWGRRFWQSQDAPALLARWGRHLPLEKLHVVTVPGAGSPPELLWQRFCSVLGVETAGHDLQPRRSNPSLGTAESELLRRVNQALSTAEVSTTDWMRWVRWLGRRLEERPGAARFSLPPADLEWLRERSEQIIAGIRDGGYPLVGDLADLEPRPAPPDRARHPSDASDAEVLAVAVDAVRDLVLELAGRGD